MTDYVVTPRALADMANIHDYSVSAWGERKARAYVDGLVTRFAWLAENPNLGRTRDDVGNGYRCFRQGSHVVFYVQNPDAVYIIGVPHASMDFEAYFKDEA